MREVKDTVLLDYDGTIADTTPLIILSWQHTYKTRYGREGDLQEILATLGEPLLDSMAKKFPEFDPYESMNIYHSYQSEICDDMLKTFPGVMETIQTLKNKGYKLGLVTSRRYESTMRGLETLELKTYIDEVITCEDIEEPKPAPQPVLSCLGKLKKSPEQALMVGDTAFDIGAANNARVTSVLVGWTASFSEDKRKGIYKPDYVIDNFIDLLSILDEK